MTEKMLSGLLFFLIITSPSEALWSICGHKAYVGRSRNSLLNSRQILFSINCSLYTSRFIIIPSLLCNLLKIFYGSFVFLLWIGIPISHCNSFTIFYMPHLCWCVAQWFKRSILLEKCHNFSSRAYRRMKFWRYVFLCSKSGRCT